MGVSARAGDAFPANGVGTPVLGVNSNGILTPIGVSNDTPQTNEINVPSAHTAAVVTFAAVPNEVHVTSGVLRSYAGSATLPSATAPGRLTIADGSDTIVDIDIGQAGWGGIVFNPPKQGHAGRAMTVTLADGGASVQGKLTMLGHWTTIINAGGQGVLDFSDEMNSGLELLVF